MGTREITYSEALREALLEEMRKDKRVMVMGEDVGIYDGVFKVTKGFLKEFGEDRVRDTPISENAIAGAGLGAAIAGLKPVVEIMYMDFINEASDQIVNHVPKVHFMSGGKLKAPLVIRTQFSLGRSTGAQHSQMMASFFMNTPGIKIAIPSTPYDAKGLLKTSIQGEDPVLFIECGQLYVTKGPVPEEEYTIPFGKADVKREGSDVTIVGISNMVLKALSAADTLKKEYGVSAEVLDPRTLAPLDRKALVASLKKTGRVVTVEPAPKTSGVGAELSATLMEEGFDWLDAPVTRVACPDTPAPFSPPLQDAYVPNEKKIIEAVKSIV
ncbi:MAG: alpha-ketoacid dehydrogenase subunit beta [Nitrososphaerota archaeon]|nr:alpha-ketoacid dehydrogenase subunit beta [Nitrososphaerota archaeon]